MGESPAVFMRLDDLTPWSQNYNQGDVSAIARSVQTFGYNGRLAVHGTTVMAGNHALAALIRLRDAGGPFPGGRGLQLNQDGSWSVLVTALDHLSFAQAEAFAIADNRTRDLATTDEQRLAALLREIADRDEDELLATGYDVDDVENLLRRLGELDADRPDAPEARLDRLKELLEEWQVQPGQLWLIPSQACPGKEHRLICGDATDAPTVQRLMGDERAVLFATDPPYLVGYDGTNHPPSDGNRQPDGSAGQVDWADVYDDQWDDPAQGEDLYRGFIRAAIDHAITEDAAWYCWHASRRQAMVERIWEELGAFVHQQIIWVKSRGVLTRSWYLWRHEPCFFGWVRGKKPRRVSDQSVASVWTVPTDEADTTSDHPTSKPTALWELPIAQHTSRGDLLYEPFSGSGTALVAAERTGRICYAVELQPAFVAVALERLREMGCEPRLASTETVTEEVP